MFCIISQTFEKKFLSEIKQSYINLFINYEIRYFFLLKIVNLFKKRDFIITNYKTNEFKTNMKKNLETIYESSCFKMDPIFSLEFDRKKYNEDLKEKAQQEQTNNTK
jgi:hypothetical protein